MGNVSLVIVSHSRKLAEGVVQLASQMAPTVCVFPCGGNGDGLGTSVFDILETLRKCPENSPILLLFDMGSALMNCEMALEMAPESVKQRTSIVDAPLVEGAVTGVIAASLGKTESEVRAEIEDTRQTKKMLR